MYEFTIPGIRGGPDQRAIVDAVRTLDSQAQLDFNWATQKVNVNSTADLAEITETLRMIGYQIERIAQRDRENQEG